MSDNNLKVGYLHPVVCTRSGSGFPSNATLVWIFYSVTANVSVLWPSSCLPPEDGHTTETCSGYWIKYSNQCCVRRKPWTCPIIVTLHLSKKKQSASRDSSTGPSGQGGGMLISVMLTGIDRSRMHATGCLHVTAIYTCYTAEGDLNFMAFVLLFIRIHGQLNEAGSRSVCIQYRMSR
jgi:hypothetical protein